MPLSRRYILWSALPILVAFAMIIRTMMPQIGEEIPTNRLVYERSSENSLRGIEQCLLSNWTGALNLRKKLSPPPSKQPVTRLDNPVRHLVVDVYDDGRGRRIAGYSRRGEALYSPETAALDRCGLGPTLY